VAGCFDDGKGFQIPYNAVAQLAQALRYKPEGRGFDTPWDHWI
jgi:hypothetical protein